MVGSYYGYYLAMASVSTLDTMFVLEFWVMNGEKERVIIEIKFIG